MTTFQIIDDKKECTGLFVDSKIEHREIAGDLTGTWTYHPLLKEATVSIASLYCSGKTIEDVCPDHLRDRWDIRKKKIQSLKNLRNYLNNEKGIF